MKKCNVCGCNEFERIDRVINTVRVLILPDGTTQEADVIDRPEVINTGSHIYCSRCLEIQVDDIDNGPIRFGNPQKLEPDFKSTYGFDGYHYYSASRNYHWLIIKNDHGWSYMPSDFWGMGTFAGDYSGILPTAEHCESDCESIQNPLGHIVKNPD